MAPIRRRRLRAEMHQEIVAAAVAQVAEGGAEALSLNAIGRTLGTSGPALYRYFASREELLAAVVTAAYDDLASTLTGAAQGARRRRPEGRFRAVAGAYRGWALDHRELYRVVFASPAGSGEQAPEEIVPAATRAMSALLESLQDVPVTAGAIPGPLARELKTWAASRQMPADGTGALARAVRAWTRLHGVVSLELEGAWTAMRLDGALLFDAEVASILA